LPHPPSADAPKATVAAPANASKAPKPSKGTKKLTIQQVKKLHREATAMVKEATGMVKEATENGDVEGLVLAEDALKVCSKVMEF
jgi:hypothetical protein